MKLKLEKSKEIRRSTKNKAEFFFSPYAESTSARVCQETVADLTEN